MALSIGVLCSSADLFKATLEIYQLEGLETEAPLFNNRSAIRLWSNMRPVLPLSCMKGMKFSENGFYTLLWSVSCFFFVLLAFGIRLFHSTYLKRAFGLPLELSIFSPSNFFLMLNSFWASIQLRQLLATYSARFQLVLSNLFLLFFKILSVSISISFFVPCSYLATLQLLIFSFTCQWRSGSDVVVTIYSYYV